MCAVSFHMLHVLFNLSTATFFNFLGLAFFKLSIAKFFKILAPVTFLLGLNCVVVWLWIAVTWWCTCVAFCVLLALPYPSPSSHLLALFLSCSP